MTTTSNLSGPTTGGSQGRPWSQPLADLSERGYVMEEYFLTGTASSYRAAPGASHGPDGRWEAERDDTADFVTRFLVVRPKDAASFNGTVVCAWLNVTAGYELGTADDDELLSGYAWVGVSAQRVGIHGFPPGRQYTGRMAPSKPLREWDPERYGSLHHPGDAFSFDIFTQVARSVGPQRSTGGDVDPMGGFSVEHLVATGASQSAGRLATYVNAVHPVEGVFDAFLLTITSGRGMALGEPEPGADPRARPSGRVRDDLDVPIMIVNSECESEGMYGNRRPDTDLYRFWEVAGAPHVVAVAPPAQPREGGRIDNPLTYRPMVSSAHRHIRRWLADGTPPPSQPLIEYTESAGRPEISRDELGNAIGGIRLPELEAPVAEYRGRDDGAQGLGTLYGWARPFPPEVLRRLYRSRDDYVVKYQTAVDRLVSSGALRPDDAHAMRVEGEKVAAGLDL